MSAAVVTWTGNRALRPLLVPADELRTHPRNPRRGDVGRIAASLRRFGQQRPLLATLEGVIVAGNHTFVAARSLDWSHVAVVRSDLSDDEVEGYLLADNRTGDLAGYDAVELAELLQPFYERDALDGIGYSTEDVRELLEAVGVLTAPFDGALAQLDRLGRVTAAGREFVLVYDDEAAGEFLELVGRIEAEEQTHGVAATVLAGLRRAVE